MEGARFRDNKDGTVADIVTKLIWQKQDDGVARNWDEAMTYAKGLKIGGHADWRLPSKHELSSLVLLNYRPTIYPIFMGTEPSLYWSSTTGANGTSVAWGVDFFGGIAGSYSKTDYYYVRCVR